MLNYERRMPRLKKIPQVKATEKDIDKLKKVILEQDVINEIRLRHTLSISKKFDEIALEAMKQAIPNDPRITEINKNIEKVESENRYAVLFEYLSTGIGIDAKSPLITKLRNKNSKLFVDVLSTLTGVFSNIFIDNALSILGGEYEYQDISDNIVETLMSGKIRDPLDFASLIMILGRSKDARHIDFLYTFYVFFKDNFSEEKYYEGPFFGLEEIINMHE